MSETLQVRVSRHLFMPRRVTLKRNERWHWRWSRMLEGWRVTYVSRGLWADQLVTRDMMRLSVFDPDVMAATILGKLRHAAFARRTLGPARKLP